MSNGVGLNIRNRNELNSPANLFKANEQSGIFQTSNQYGMATGMSPGNTWQSILKLITSAGKMALPGAVGNLVELPINLLMNYIGSSISNKDRMKAFDATNAYNHPRMVMDRLNEAGLNPNLIYDGGQASVPAANPGATDTIAPNLNNIIGQHTDRSVAMATQFANVERLAMANLNAAADLDYKYFRNLYNEEVLPWMIDSYKLSNGLLGNRNLISNEQVSQAIWRTKMDEMAHDIMRVDWKNIDTMHLQWKFDEFLARNQMTKGDPLIMRKLFQGMNTIEDAIKGKGFDGKGMVPAIILFLMEYLGNQGKGKQSDRNYNYQNYYFNRSSIVPIDDGHGRILPTDINTGEIYNY